MLVPPFRDLAAGGIGLGIGVGIGGWVANALPSVTTSAQVRARFFAALAGQGRPGHVALTFDDGPDPSSTPEFLDLLARHGIQSTFFVLGSMLERAPALAQRMVGEGHEIAVHGWTHRSLLLRGPGTTAREISRTVALIEATTGQRPRFYRPPYGILTTSALAAARAARLVPVLWTAWGRDWTADATSEGVLDTLGPDMKDGATVLLHDSDCTSAPQSWRSSLGALPALLDRCAAAGWQVGPLREHGLGRRSRVVE